MSNLSQTGGAHRVRLPAAVLRSCAVISGSFGDLCDEDLLVHDHPLEADEVASPGALVVDIPLQVIVPYLMTTNPEQLLKLHSVHVPTRSRTVALMRSALVNHTCGPTCQGNQWLLRRPVCCVHRAYDGDLTSTASRAADPGTATSLGPTEAELADIAFPPEVPDTTRFADIADEWIKASSAEALAESPCAVCAQLVKSSTVVELALDEACFDVIRERVEDVLPAEFRREGDGWKSILSASGICRRVIIGCASGRYCPDFTRSLPTPACGSNCAHVHYHSRYMFLDSGTTPPITRNSPRICCFS